MTQTTPTPPNAPGASPAASAAAPAHEDNLLQLVTFHIGDEEFGVDILSVQEIIRPMQITMVPHAANYIEGVINLRGKVIPVINMRTRFNLPPVERDSRTRIVVMEFNQKIVGFLVDGVSEVLRIPASTVEPAPPVVCGIGSEYIRGVGKLDDRLLILLDLDTLLSDTKAEVG
ncbi:chemotaxis protein CheW [Desulfovibrio legallii]|uniref:Chemotaxis protein CheW n=1 Tax=Desulfovibrio legallii TaxID=571438 RepID=A0A1G7Q4X2_9BACT|nr:chemotaxis protein CheW [Desulfovibrio legallii]SDF93533.1 purine-binding chemotaxis protein CheW [Desulfovibrio legallii]